MSVLNNNHPTAEQFSKAVQAYYNLELPYILASEVLSEVEKRCGSGQQYTTFPNRIKAAEKAKVEAKGYIITENTVHAENRDGAPDMYIGFQVALNPTAATEPRPMNISEKEINGGGLY